MICYSQKMSEKQVKEEQLNELIRVNHIGEQQQVKEEYQRPPVKRIKLQDGDQKDNEALREPLIQQAIVQQIPTWTYWKHSVFYNKLGNVFTKINENCMRKVCAQEPLPKRGIFKFSLKVIAQGTISFGIITDFWTSEFPHLVDWVGEEAIFLTSFNQNGGVMNVDGKVQTRGDKLHLNQGQRMFITIDMQRKFIIYVKNETILRVPFTPHFVNKPIYPFFQVKGINSSIQIEKNWQ